MRVQPNTSKPLGHAQITGLSSKKGLVDGGAIPSATQFALLQAEGADVRWRDDGPDPTATVGMVLKAGDPPFVYDGDMTALEFIETGASAKLNVAYYGYK
ncbi:MAG: hypothetical protein DI570_09235 [Phenylobacterium zucineum]|nr:MAG: hypothetical protein DI570_09235 [Phenylobacterium zucineum]